MGAGGILAVLGDKTALSQAALFASGGLFTKHNAANVGEIQYDAGAGFVNMTGATENTDYTLTYSESPSVRSGTAHCLPMRRRTEASPPYLCDPPRLRGSKNTENPLKSVPEHIGNENSKPGKPEGVPKPREGRQTLAASVS